ncbi:phenylacetate--CoA ligase family protein [Ottowia testudinis]|uniref:Phenylacetate--CoA ligase family protein n=1 Tax=Ottowia testudinis TaxID=2816950 RepID=A0A975CD02_9BURK|nr:AMP-binding protein [Ottowia testudinis]QTD44198.1 phenylacetate--CoA ligase family protein [Ottowia testudinis]
MSAAGAVFDALHLQAAMLDVVAAGHAPPTLIAQRQQQRVLRLLDAARGAALYRERLGDARRQRSSDLSRLPPVTRRELMERFDDWVTNPVLRLDELQAFLRDPACAGEPWLGRYMVWESSGTSGQPGVFVHDAQCLAVYDALEAVRHRAPSRNGRGLFSAFTALDMLGGGDRHALVTATGGHFASVVSFERLRRINPWLAASSRSFSLLQPVEELVQALNDFQPTVLATYPTAAALLADEAAAGRLAIRPRCVLTGGESLSKPVRERVAQVFGAPVRASYGASEFLPIAWECAHGHLHVNEDWVLLEPVDEKFRPLPPGQRSHSVLLTNLANLVQPLIRYDLGDQVAVSGERCSCGSALQVIDVQGRADDVLQVPGRRKGQKVSLLPLALCTVVEEEGGVFDFQLQQQGPSTLVLRLPLRGDEAEAAIGRCRDALQHFAALQGAEPIVVLGEPGCDVPRGRSGKACRVAMDGGA